jgi:hypothetical protein
MGDYEGTTESRTGSPESVAGDPNTTTRSSSQRSHMAGQAKQNARAAVHQARSQVESMLGEQKSIAAGQVEGLARALHTTAEQLRAQDQAPVAGWIDRSADGLDRLCGSLRERDLDSLAAQVQDYARRQPGVFLGGALATGFLMARFLKSSSSSSHWSEQSYSGAAEYARSSTDSRPVHQGSGSESMNAPKDSISTPT